jgi:SAM domain (Sterile alpha motif)
VSPSNPSSDAKPKKSRPRPVRPTPEQRLAALVSKHPMTWSNKDVGDWLECLAFGKYRKAFTHSAVTGQLLPKLTESVLKEELGVSSFGHREMILRAITGLFECWAKEEGVDATSPQGTSASPYTTPKSGGQLQAQSPVITIPGAEILRAQERRTRLAHDLEKATSRAAQRHAAAEQAKRNAELANKEVERLNAALKEAEIEAQGGKFGMAIKGAGGKHLQSPVRKKELPGVDDTNFMSRLQADLQAREKKAKMAAGKVKNGNKGIASSPGAAAATGVETESAANSDNNSFKNNFAFLQSICAEKDPSFTEFLQMPNDSDEEGKTKLSTKLDDLVGRLAGELGIDDKDVEIVKNAQGPNKKAQKLTLAVKKAIFMQRLEQDLSARQQRNKELKEQVKAERAAAAKAAEEKDLKEANEVFAELGWPVEAIQGGNSTGDDLLGALLKRARAAQVARAAAKAVDWELHAQDGLLALISEVANSNIPAATAADTNDLSAVTSSTTSSAKPPMPASGPPVLLETVNLLSYCRGDELDRLETLKGTKKLLAVYRALRAQEFLRTTREKLEAKAAKAAEYEESQRPTRKVLPKEAGEAFLQRLNEDAARRARNR